MTTALEVTPQKVGALRHFLNQAIADDIAGVISDVVTPEKLTAIIVAEAVRNPKIFQALHENPDSVATVCLLAAQLGLDASSPLGHFYIIPRNIDRRMTLTHIVGAKGYIELARRAGVTIRAGVVYEDELTKGQFEWCYEPPVCAHTWMPGIDRSDEHLRLAYAIAERRNERHQRLMERDEIMKRRAVAQTKKVWDAWFPEMCRKTVVRRLLASGDVPLSDSLQVALEHDVEQLEPEPVEITAHPVADPLRDRLGLPGKRPPPEFEWTQQDIDGLPLGEQVVHYEIKLDAEQRDAAAKAAGVNFDAALADQDQALVGKYRDELRARVEQGRLL